jgi:hypothetical protein
VQFHFLLDHASVLTAERYFSLKQNMEEPVNDQFGPLYKGRLNFAGARGNLGVMAQLPVNALAFGKRLQMML